MARRVPYHRPGPPPLRAYYRTYERRPDRQADKNFYCTEPWPTVRRAYLAAHPLCATCYAKGIVTVAAHVHHKIERKERPDLAYDHENLEALCIACHGRKRGAPGLP